MTSNGALSWRIEEACWNAFPALKLVVRGPWLFRFAEGLSRRANSVNPLGPAATGVAATIATAEELYPAQRLPAIFRIPSIVDGALDRALAAQGYTSEGESCVLYGAMDALATRADPGVRLLASPAPRWLAAMAWMQGHTAAQRATYRRIMQSIAIPARFALFAVDGEPAALAYGAIHDRLLCYESVITAPLHRRQGLSRRVIATLAAWAHEAGAIGACLEVEAGNDPALALYAAFGLAELYRYHYRRAPPRG